VPDERGQTGQLGEDAALDAYRHLGFQLVARNWRCRIGELDLIVTRGDMLVFCEVKTRRGIRFGGGYEAVTGRKRAKVRATAEAFLLAMRPPLRCIRFDVASVALGPSGPQVELFEDAF
jgi:putative endonuclease